MIIAIFHNTAKSHATEIAKSIREFLTTRSVDVLAEDDEAASIGAGPLSSVQEEDVDFCISLGGDGTILRLIHKHPLIQAPILAINLGGLGFMADIPVDEIFTSLRNLLEGNYSVESRLVIEGKTPSDHSSFAAMRSSSTARATHTSSTSISTSTTATSTPSPPTALSSQRQADPPPTP